MAVIIIPAEAPIARTVPWAATNTPSEYRSGPADLTTPGSLFWRDPEYPITGVLVLVIQGNDLGRITLRQGGSSEMINPPFGGEVYTTTNSYDIQTSGAFLSSFTSFVQGTVTMYAQALYNEYIESLTVYNTVTVIERSIRRLVSPDVANPLTESDLPSSIILDPFYLDFAEQKVLADTKTSVAEVERYRMNNDAKLQTLVRLVQLQIAIVLIPQLPQIIREGALDDQTQYQTIDAQKRIMQLEDQYEEEVAILEDDDVDPGNLILGARLTKSRAKNWLR